MLLGEDDAELGVVQDRHVAVLGYGADGPAHALTLRDCGVDVRVGLPEASADRADAEAEGLRVVTAYEACEEADLVVVLAPEQEQGALYAAAIEDNLVDGDAIVFRSGFTVRYGLLQPPPGVDVCMVTPTAPGPVVRSEYTEGRGVPVLVAVDQDATGSAWALTLSYAKALGGLRAGGIRTTFAEATDARLFGEQAVVAGFSELFRAGFETLAEAGHSPEVAYLACLSELRGAADSAVAAFGGLVSGPRVVGDSVRQGMSEVLDDIRDGAFAKRFAVDQDSGGRHLADLRARAEQHPVTTVAAEVRAMMAWLSRDDD